MEKMTLTEQKLVMMEILIYIDQLADKHNLRYSLWGGTLLGAVRHKGFIPWDDDIDISLPREDYEKLLKLLINQNKYKLFEYSLQENYTWSWAKLTHKGTEDNKKKYFHTGTSHGIFVDIVPIDGFPLGEKDIKTLKRKLHRLNLIIRSSQFHNYASSIHLPIALKKLVLLFPLFVYSRIRGGKETFTRKLNQLSVQYSLYEADKCGHLLSRYKTNLGYPSSIWDELKIYGFEGHSFKGIADSHTYLTLLYGEDYMKIPPKEKQVTHEEHEFYRMEGVRYEYSDDNGQWQGTENGSEYSKTIY